MKHIYRRFILSAVLVFPVVISAGAQELAGDNASSLQNDSLVQVAFRKVSQNNLLGGASVVNVEELTKKNYNTWSLTDMQGYVGGYNGNSLWGMDEKLILVDGVPRTTLQNPTLPKPVPARNTLPTHPFWQDSCAALLNKLLSLP